jgi:FlaA1/EpsC-like NDP-sugar epimerase
MDFSYQQITGRSELVSVDFEKLRNNLGSETVLVTGAGGSIGSEITKLLASHGVKEFFALDIDGNALHRLQLELGSTALFDNRRFILCDIRLQSSIREVISVYKPTTVIHAAAQKHLSALERFPVEGFQANVVGTLNVLKACVDADVKRFINVSTDKAASPVSVLGKTKRITELLVSHYTKSNSNNLKGHSVRFGNVFASHGSVIETFSHQIRNNQPITLTDLRVARYFMSIFEASMLVLETLKFESTGGVYILEMGEQIELHQIAKKLMEVIGREVPIEITGLRPGEKLFEDLISLDEIAVGTKVDQINFVTPEIKSKLTTEQIESLVFGTSDKFDLDKILSDLS